MGASSPWLRSAYQDALIALDGHDMSPTLGIWLYMTGAAAMLEERDNSWVVPQLRSYLDSCGTWSWEKLKALLGSFVWISKIRSVHGETVFRAVWEVRRMSRAVKLPLRSHTAR